MMRAPESYFPIKQFGIVKAVTPVSGGLSGTNVYAVTTELGEFFLHLHGKQEEDFGVMLTAQRLAAKEGIAPNVILVEAEDGAVITEKAKGMPIGAALAQRDVRPLVLRSLAEMLARLHAIPASNIPPLDPSLGQSIWDQQSEREGFPDWAKPLGTFINSGSAAIAQDGRRVLSHNDVNPANLIWDGSKVWLVDWERAALAHPYMDLAIFSTFAILPVDDAVDLLAIQERSPISALQRATFLSMINYARAIYGAVFLRLVPDLTDIEFMPREATPTLPECYADLAKGQLNLGTPSGQAQFGAAQLRQLPVAIAP